MSRGLFQRKHIPFEDKKDDTKTDDIEEIAFDFGGKKKSLPRTSSTSTQKSVESVGDKGKIKYSGDEGSPRKRATATDSVILIESEDEEQPTKKTKADSKLDVQTTMNLYDIGEDISAEASSILKRFESVRRTASTSSSSSVPLKETTITTDTSTYSIPKILTASERQKLAQEYKLPTKGKGKEKQPIEDEFEEEDEGAVLKIKTRLNGSDEMFWMLNPTNTFFKLKQKLAKRYNVDISQISLSFDGEKIEEDDTPEGLDMEENFLVDVKMDRKLLAKALEHALSKKK